MWIGEGENSAEELAAIDALLATLEYNNNNGTPSNWMDLGKLTVDATTVTADFSNGVQADIKAIYEGLGSKIVEGKVTGADNVEKDAYEYAIDSYVMNTFARYLGAIGRGNANKNTEGTYTTPVSKIIFNNVEYIWNGTLNGSNWKTAEGVTLVSAAALAEESAIRTVNLTLVDENNYSVDVTFTATNVPTKAAIWD